MAGHEDIMLALGRIEGKVDGIENTQVTHGKALVKVDDRLRAVEAKAARNGLVAGTMAAVGVTLIKNGILGG